MQEHIQQRRGLSPNTAKKYGRAMHTAIDFVESLIKRTPRIRELTLDRLQAWLDSVKKAGRSPSSLGVKRAALVAYFDYLRWLRRIGPAEDPTADLLVPPLKRPKKRYMPEALAVAMVAQPLAGLRPDEPIPMQALRNHAILWMLYEGGFRVSELATLQLTNLVFDCPEGYVVALVKGKGEKERFVPLKKSMGPLRAYLARRHEIAADGETAVFPHLFTGRQLTGGALSSVVLKYAVELGVKVNAHLFRHTAATLTRLEGGTLSAIQENLGHTEERTTRTYAGATVKLIIDQALLFHPCNRDARPKDPGQLALEVTVSKMNEMQAELARMTALLQQRLGGGAAAAPERPGLPKAA